MLVSDKCNRCEIIQNIEEFGLKGHICNSCARSKTAERNKTKQFCTHEHDTFVTGRDKRGRCRVCSNESSDKWTKTHPEQHLESSRKRANKWYNTNRDVARIALRIISWKRLEIINLDGTSFSLPDYEKAYENQQGKCAICGRHQSEFKRALATDHDHVSGIFRGLLCSGCNQVLGSKENLAWNAKADVYLSTFKGANHV